MKYDVVIGNPPYQHSNSAQVAKKIYPKFIQRAMADLKDNGYLVYVTPDSWIKSKAPGPTALRQFILQHNPILVEDVDHHFKIGDSVSYFIVSNESYKGHSKIYDFEGHFDNIPKTIEDKIFDKVYATNNSVKDRRVSLEVVKPDRPKHFKDQQDEEYSVKVYHTIPQTFWARPIIAEWAYTPKVILNGSGYYRVWKPEGPAVANKAANAILCEDDEHASKAAQWLNHKLFHFICETQRTGGFVNQCWLAFPYPEKNIVDTNPYNYFGLTLEEIEYVEQYHIHYRSL